MSCHSRADGDHVCENYDATSPPPSLMSRVSAVESSTFEGTAMKIFACVLFATVLMSAQAPPREVAATGDAKRGKTLFDQTYRCYACHGYAGETGSPRLVPMSRTEDAFVDFVRKPPRAAMPSFADVPAQDLADVY